MADELLPLPTEDGPLANPTPATLTPEQLDVEAFTQSAGGFRRGVRSGFNQLGAMTHAFAANVGASLGLTDFAATRWLDAQQYADFADAVAPEVRDYRSVKDLDTLSGYLAGLGGQAAASFLPAAVGGAVGARFGGLRGAYVGLGAGSFVPNAGEQALRVRGKGTPLEQTVNAVGVGGVNAALDVVAPGGVAAKLAKPIGKQSAKAVAKDIGKTTLAEGATEGLQEVVGQQGERVLDPTRSTADDVPQIINSAIGGAVGGAGLGGAGALAQVAKRGPDALRAALKQRDPVIDDNDLSSITASEETDPTRILEAIDGRKGESDASLDKEYAASDDATKAKFKDYKDDPEARAGFMDHAKKAYNDSEIAPRVKSAFDRLKKRFTEAHEAGKQAAGKKSLQRTAHDANILDFVTKRLPEHIRNNLTPEQRIEHADRMKHYAMHGFGKRTEVEGPMPGAKSRLTQDDGAKDVRDLHLEPVREQDRGTMPERIPNELLYYHGKDTVGTLQGIQDILKAGGIPHGKHDFKASLDASVRDNRSRNSELDAVILKHMKDDLYADADMRKASLAGFKRMLDSVEGNSPEEFQKLQEKATASGDENQRLTAHGKNLMEAAGYIFKDRPEAMHEIESLRKGNELMRDFHLTDEEISDLEPEYGAGDQAAQSFPGDEEFGPRAEANPFMDERLSQVHDSVASAKATYDALTGEYEAKKVRFRVKSQLDDAGNPSGKLVISAHDAEGEDTLSKAQWKRLTPGSNQSGFENSVITVRTKDAPGGKKVDVRALTAEAMRSIDAPGRSATGSYVADMVLRGLGMLLGDSQVTGLGKKTEEQIDFRNPNSWDIPGETVVAVMGKGENRVEYTWDKIKAMAKIAPEELEVRRETSNAVERAQRADSIAEIETSVQPDLEEAAAREADKAKDAADVRDRARKMAAGLPWGSPERDDAWASLKDLRAEAAKLKGRAGRYSDAMESVEDEIDRRKREGDKPYLEIGENNIDSKMLEAPNTMREQDRPGPRRVQEETGLPVHGKPGKGPSGKFATGIRDEGKGAKPLKDPAAETLARRAEKPEPKAEPKKAEEPKLVPSIAMEREFRQWLQDNDGKTINDFLKEIIHYTGGARKIKALLPEARTLLGYKMPKKSDVRVGGTLVTDAQKKAVRAEVKRLLGDTARVLFKNLDHAGEFANMDGVEVLKVANQALDHMGTARHEATHALVERLLKSDKHAAQTLLAAAGSPTVVSQLNKLLKGHPEAIKQLSDPEERLAYMYQFWAAGELNVGPKTKTWFDKIKGFFRAAAGFWSETFSDMSNVEKAEKIFEIFQSGGFADKNTVAEVLRDRLPKSAFDRATEVMGPAWKFLDKAFSTSEGYVRAMNIPALTRIAEQFYSPLGKDNPTPGYNQAKHVAANTYLNRLHDALEGTSEAGRRQALEAMQSNSEPASAEAKKIVAAVRPLLKDMFDYMVKKKVKAVVWNKDSKKYDEKDIQFVADYFPRYYDRQRIMENHQAFLAMLKKNGFDWDASLDLTHRLTGSSKVDPAESDESAGLTYYAPNTQARKLDIPAAELAPFLRKDLYGTLASYITYATRRGEYAERFGNQGDKIEAAVQQAIGREGAKPDQIRAFSQAVQAWEGSLGHDMKPELRKAFGAAITYQNVRLLPLALFSSLVDPVGIAVRGGTMGEAFGAFVRGIRELAGQHKDEAFELAKLAGSIATAHDAHMLADAYGSQYMTPWQRRINEVFFKFNGLESWNRSMRVAATAAAEQFIIRHATKPGEHSERYLRELGLTKDDVKGGKVDVTDQKIKDAINLWVDGAVLRPNAAIRPIWMSDPRWMLVSHLKQFTYSFQKTIISRVVHEIENGNYTPAYALLSYVPTILAADMLRAMLTPGGADDDRLEKLGLGGMIGRGVQRAGLFGPGQYALDAYGDLGHSKMPLVSLGGPTATQLYEFGQAAATPGGDVGKELLKAVPGYTLVR